MHTPLSPARVLFPLHPAGIKPPRWESVGGKGWEEGYVVSGEWQMAPIFGRGT